MAADMVALDCPGGIRIGMCVCAGGESPRQYIIGEE